MNISEEMIRQVITEVIQQAKDKDIVHTGNAPCGFDRVVDKSGIIAIKTSTVNTEPFEQEGVSLKDVTTLEEAPRMGCGIMELDHTSFEWTLTYDEYDFVIEGTLEIEIDGRVVTGHPGDIIYIPKNSHIHFQTPDKTRYAYFVYPANWSELA